MPLRVPALRERASDIHLLTMFFVQKFTKKMGKQINQISDAALHQLTSYPGGNIRELQNVIERAVILSPGNVLLLAEELRALVANGVLAALPKTKVAEAISVAPAAGNGSSLDGSGTPSY